MMAGPIAKHLSTFSRLITSSTTFCHQTFPAVRTVIRHDNYFVRAFTHFFFQDDEIFIASSQYSDNTVTGSLQSLYDRKHRSNTYTTTSADYCSEFSIWVACPSGPTTSVIDSPSFSSQRRVEESPTSCTTRVMVPFSGRNLR